MALLCLARYYDAAEAEVARAALESAGIQAFVFDGGIAQTAWYYSHAVGIRLMVPEEQAADAGALLTLPAPEMTESEPLDTCPACGGTEVARLYSWWSLVPSQLTAIPFLFARLRRRCRNCGHRWRVPVLSNKGPTA